MKGSPMARNYGPPFKNHKPGHKSKPGERVVAQGADVDDLESEGDVKGLLEYLETVSPLKSANHGPDRPGWKEEDVYEGKAKSKKSVPDAHMVWHAKNKK